MRRARRLRRKLSLPEVLLWARLRRSDGARFRRQHPLGRYVVDFYCPAAKLAVEVDGAQHGTPQALRSDAERDGWLRAQGVRVVRVPASDVLRDADSVAEWLLQQAG